MDSTEKIYCCECGEELQGAMYHIGGEDYICEDCRENYYTHCDHCDALVPNEEITDVDNNRRFVCRECADYYYTCSHCGQLFSHYYIAADTYYITLCTNCYEDHYFTCEDCGEVYRQDEAEYIGGQAGRRQGYHRSRQGSHLRKRRWISFTGRHGDRDASCDSRLPR